MNINSKIKDIRTSLGLSQDLFAKRIGLSRSNLSQIEIGKSNPTYDTINKIVSVFNIDANDLFDANKIHNTVVNEPTPSYKAVKAVNGIPLIPISAIAGNGNGGVAIVEEDIKERYVVPEFGTADFMIMVKGSSMYPKYNSGDIVACKMLTDRNFFQWGKVYVLHDKEQGAMIKRLFPTNKDSIVECRSDNDKYPPFKVDLSNINNLALVIGVIRLE